MNGVDASTVTKDGSLRRTISLKDDLIENGVTGVGKRWYKQWVDSFLFTFIGFHCKCSLTSTVVFLFYSF